MVQLINWRMYLVLEYIRDNKDACFMKIENYFKANPTTVKLWLDYFRESGYLLIERSKKDKRVNILIITEKGLRTLRLIKEIGIKK